MSWTYARNSVRSLSFVFEWYYLDFLNGFYLTTLQNKLYSEIYTPLILILILLLSDYHKHESYQYKYWNYSLWGNSLFISSLDPGATKESNSWSTHLYSWTVKINTNQVFSVIWEGRNIGGYKLRVFPLRTSGINFSFLMSYSKNWSKFSVSLLFLSLINCKQIAEINNCWFGVNINSGVNMV